jgi:IPT/TIG domain
MSMMSPIRRAVGVFMILPGLAGCSRSSEFAPSPTPDPSPTSAAIEAHSMFPESGATWRETAVEILGAGFQPGAAVKFGSAAASNVSVVNSTTIWARAPVSVAGAVDVVVTNRGGQSATLARAFTFLPVELPTLTTSASAVIPGSQLSVSWTTQVAGPQDYIGLFVVGSSSEEPSIWYQYTGGKTAGTSTLTAPNQSGQYEFRYLPDDEHTDVARSRVVTVTQ